MLRNGTRFRLLAAAIAAAGIVMLASEAGAQPVAVASPGYGVWLPSYYGGATPLSAAIRAEADYIASAGYAAEAVSRARINHAIAAEQEIRNAELWVSTYFRMREINRAARLKENPNFLMREAKRQKVMEDKMDKFFQLTLQGDVTEELNWLLRELSGPATAYQYLPGDRTLADSNLDRTLVPGEVQLIRLTDGHGSVFAADEGKLLRTNWPMALKHPLFDDVRANFEKCRDDAIEELKKNDGEVSWETGMRLREAVNRVADAFNAAYPREVRTQSGMAYVEYADANRFVRSLALGVLRVLKSQDLAMLDGSKSFAGNSVVDLLLHMNQNSLVFAEPPPGGEELYKNLFLTMRGLYLSLTPDEAVPQAAANP